LKPASNVIRPNVSEKHRRMPIVPTARAMAAAIGTPSMHSGSTARRRRAPAGMLVSEVAHDQRAEFVIVDCGQSMAASRSPGCQSRSPTKSNPVP
jgi:hypothetical protein